MHTKETIFVDCFFFLGKMGAQKKTKRFASVKRMITPKDQRLYAFLTYCFFRNENKKKAELAEKKAEELKVRHVPQVSSSLFFAYNKCLFFHAINLLALGPPYHVIVDTNFINFSLQNKLEMVQAMMDCLYAKCVPCISDCVMAELEKMGTQYRIALKVARDPRFERLPCIHKGTYADDCIVQRVTSHKCYIVATCDRELKRRIRKIPGIPIMSIGSRKYHIERLPELGGSHSAIL